MAIFEENRLRPEEIAGGFDRESAEDTFLLDSLDAYPGELPDMFNLSEQLEVTLNPPEPEPPGQPEPMQAEEIQAAESDSGTSSAGSEYLFEDAIEQETAEPETVEPEADTPTTSDQTADDQSASDSVWDVFEQEQPAFDTSKEAIDFADLADQPASERIQTEDENLVSGPTERPDPDELLTSAKLDAEIDDDVFASASELIDPDLLMSAPAPKAEQEITESELEMDTQGISFVEETISDEPISNADILGDDLKSLIEQDLARAKSRKPRASEEPAKELTNDEIRDKLSEFKAVDDSNPDVLIDLTAIHTEHPSSVLAGNAEAAQDIDIFAVAEEKQPAKKEKKNKNAAQPAPDEPAPAEDKPKKQRKPLPWKRIGISAAALFALGAIGYGIYFVATMTNLVADIQSGITSMFIPDTATKADTANSEQMHSGQTAPKEDTKAEEKPATQAVQAEAPKEETKTEIKKEEAKPAPKPTVAEAPKHETEKQKQPEKAKPAPEKKTDIAKAKAEVPKKKPVAKIKDIAQIRKEAKEGKEGKKTITNKNKQAAAKPESRDAVYTVEVYSSPSRDDAEDWVRSLSKRKVQNVFIKEQKIRDVVWYKVRFGQFLSKEEAKQTAEKHGFSHIWIDRVK